MKKRSSFVAFLLLGLLFITLQSGGCKKDSEGYSSPLYGTPGPAGGIIFYDKGYYSDGWRYLEVSPYDIHDPVFWGCNVKIPDLNTEIGTGKLNTQKIVDFQKNSDNDTIGCATSYSGTKTAAILCTDYSLNGYDDWFLPSDQELNLMVQNLYENHLGNLYPYQSYWSSTQTSFNETSVVWARAASNFTHAGINKTCVARIRAIRAY